MANRRPLAIDPVMHRKGVKEIIEEIEDPEVDINITITDRWVLIGRANGINLWATSANGSTFALEAVEGLGRFLMRLYNVLGYNESQDFTIGANVVTFYWRTDRQMSPPESQTGSDDS